VARGLPSNLLTFEFMLDQGWAFHSKSGGFFDPFSFFNMHTGLLIRSFSFVIAAALRLRLSIRAVRGLLTVVVAGITLPAGSALFAQQVTTLAGSGQSGSIDGTGTMATFTGPTGVAVGADGTVYVADNVSNKIRKITAAGVVTTLAGSGASGRTDGTGTMAILTLPGESRWDRTARCM
jgi:hypothetical protein